MQQWTSRKENVTRLPLSICSSPDEFQLNSALNKLLNDSDIQVPCRFAFLLIAFSHFQLPEGENSEKRYKECFSINSYRCRVDRGAATLLSESIKPLGMRGGPHAQREVLAQGQMTTFNTDLYTDNLLPGLIF